jgi:flagellar biosynthesis/type III secretory pathway protein FliH
MKKELKAVDIIPWLEKKTAELEGTAILSQTDYIKSDEKYSLEEILNKMYQNGYNKGYVLGARDILVDISNMLKDEE